jgi:ssDNA-binding Zn-finger/Zn-ribbon topoisomerase 1
MTFLKLDKNLGAMGSNTLKHCEYCESPIAWYWTDKSIYGGNWTYCLLNRHKEGSPPKSDYELNRKKEDLRQARKAKKETTSDGAPICPNCNIVMIRRKGRYGEFWGCPRYPKCKITERIRN